MLGGGKDGAGGGGPRGSPPSPSESPDIFGGGGGRASVRCAAAAFSRSNCTSCAKSKENERSQKKELGIRRYRRRGIANLHDLHGTRVLLEFERNLHEELLRVAVPEGPEASRGDVQVEVVQSGGALGNGGRGVLEASEPFVHLARRDLERDRLVRLGREQDVLPAPIGRLHVLLVSGHKTVTRNDTCTQISC